MKIGECPLFSAIEIPLFPLGTVLFPGGPLPLRIFETRYIDLVRRCLRDGSGFGVVLIREGAEAGGPALTFDVGTYARIVDFSQQPDGLLGIQAAGERRFRILERRRARDGLNLADVEWLPDELSLPLPEEFAELGPALDAILAQVGEPYAALERQRGRRCVGRGPARRDPADCPGAQAALPRARRPGRATALPAAAVRDPPGAGTVS